MTTKIDTDEVDAALSRLFADGVRLQRLSHRWSQEQLANGWGVSRQAIVKMENPDSTRKVTFSDLLTACAIFRCDAGQLLLLGRNDEDKKPFLHAMSLMFPKEATFYAHWYDSDL